METDNSWQSVLSELFRKVKQTIEFKSFSQSKTDYFRIHTCLLDENIRKAALQWLKSCMKDRSQSKKSSVLSSNLRIEGNKLFQKNNNQAALDKYTQSVLFAPYHEDKREPELSLAFANRSAVLFLLEKYQECLKDIEFALDHAYPKNLCYKLYHRRAKCLFALELKNQAKEAVNLALRHLKSANLNHTAKDKFTSELLKMATSIAQSKDSDSSCSAIHCESPLPSVADRPHTTLSYASSLLKLVYNTDQGRHIVANKNIQAGDVLMVEKPYASVLLYNHSLNHCHHCYKTTFSSLPCKFCNEVGFCSQTCLQQAWESYHNIECGHMKFFHNIGLAHLALRIILITGKKNLKDFLADLKDPSLKTSNDIPGCSSNGSYGNSYHTVYHLMSHTEDIKTTNLFYFSVTACLLLMFLKRSKFFSSNGNFTNIESFEPFEVEIGGLLLRHLQQLVCNAHAITDLEQDRSDIVYNTVITEFQERIATAIYPTASLMNHSCKPNIIHSFCNDIVIVKAVKNILPGEQVYNCYGPHYSRMTLDERKLSLKQQYFFNCQCEACESKLDANYFKSLKCKYCDGPVITPPGPENFGPIVACFKCGGEQSIVYPLEVAVKAETLFLEASALDLAGKTGSAISLFHKCELMQAEVYHNDNLILARTRDCLAKCYSEQGKFIKASNLLKRCLPVIEIVYGEGSIEMGNELLKFSDVLSACVQQHVNQDDFWPIVNLFEELKQVLKKALKIFKMHYSETHASLKEVQTLQNQVELVSGIISGRNRFGFF